MDSKSIVNHKLIERIKAHKYNVRDKRGNCSLYRERIVTAMKNGEMHELRI